MSKPHSSLGELLPSLPYKVPDRTMRVFTEEKRALMLFHVEKGHPYTVCCMLSGVSPDYWRGFYERAMMDLKNHQEVDAPLTPAAEFITNVLYFRGLWLAKKLAFAEKAVVGDPKLWYMEIAIRERLDPDFAKKSTVRVQEERRVTLIMEERGEDHWQTRNLTNTDDAPILEGEFDETP